MSAVVKKDDLVKVVFFVNVPLLSAWFRTILWIPLKQSLSFLRSTYASAPEIYLASACKTINKLSTFFSSKARSEASRQGPSILIFDAKLRFALLASLCSAIFNFYLPFETANSEIIIRREVILHNSYITTLPRRFFHYFQFCNSIINDRFAALNSPKRTFWAINEIEAEKPRCVASLRRFFATDAVERMLRIFVFMLVLVVLAKIFVLPLLASI